MKALLIVLLLALAILMFFAPVWAGEVHQWSNSYDSYRKLYDSSYALCPNGHEYLGEDRCILKKGHCPHCGAKGIMPQSIDEMRGAVDNPYWHKIGTFYLCPNGHLFWEKD